jgi:hypothetical protein
MARMYEAECLQACQANYPSYQFYVVGKVYTISEDAPEAKYFRRIGPELPKEEVARIQEEGPPPPRETFEPSRVPETKRVYTRK